MPSLQTRGRKSQRVAAARHVGGRVVGLKPGACSDGQKPSARQFSSIPLTLMSLHNAPALLVGSPVSHHHKYRKSGGGSALPSRREPFRFSVAVLLREPRVGWCELTSQPVDESERDRKVFSHLTRSPS